jgi:hypothetical protein
MKATEVKVEVLKNKLMASFSHYVSGNLYYNVLLESGLYQFPIPTVEEGPTFNDDESGLSMYEIETVKLSSDLGTTSFDAHIKASLLNRWIGKAIEKGEFIKID